MKGEVNYNKDMQIYRINNAIPIVNVYHTSSDIKDRRNKHRECWNKNKKFIGINFKYPTASQITKILIQIGLKIFNFIPENATIKTITL